MQIETYPHDGVYVRLKNSGIHGVGVFAIRDIPARTEIFRGNDSKTVVVEKEIADRQGEEIKKLYGDFCALEDGKYYCPDSFNNLDVSYFMNESETPNVATEDGYHFYAIRDIKNGEELTLDYATFSE